MASQDRTAVTSPTTRETTSAFRSLPAVNEVAESAILAGWLARTPRTVVVDAVRAVLGEFRAELAGAGDIAVPTLDQFAERTVSRLQRQERPRLRPVINATGIILHT